MSKHTNGPWHTDSGMDTNGRKTLVFGDDNLLVCDCAPGFTAADWETGGDESEANARLIAAAPDLLEALQALCSMNSPGWKMGSDEAIRRWDAARAAIARATSE